MPVAALVVSDDRRLRQGLLALAASAGVRAHPVGGRALFSGVYAPLPDAPLTIFGPDVLSDDAVVEVLKSARFAGTRAVVASLTPVAPDRLPDGVARYCLPAHEPQLLKLLVNAANTVSRSATVIEVRGATGGAGTTTAALLLAGAASSLDHDVTVIESGASPPALELILGLENQSAVRWADLLGEHGSLRDLPHPEALRAALPRAGALRILARGGANPVPSNDAVGEVVASLARERGIIILDAGSHPRPERAEGVGVRSEISALVVPRTVTAVVRASEELSRSVGAKPVVVTRARRGGVLTGRDVERAIPTRLIGELPEISGLQNMADRGVGLPSAKARCWRVMRQIFTDLLATIGNSDYSTEGARPIRVVK